MAVDRVLHQVQKDDQKPVVLIDGDSRFIGYFLARLLEQQDCRIISLKEIPEKKEEKVDYVFSLQETDLKKIKKLSGIAERFNARLLLTIPEKKPVEKNLQDFLQAKKIDWRIVRLGDVYGPRMDFNQYQELVQLIKVVKVHPLFVADVVYGLVRAMFGTRTAGKIFDLSEKSGLDWRPKVSLEEGLRQTEKFFSQEKKEPGQLEGQREIQPRIAVTLGKNWALATVTALVLVLLLALPFLSFFFYGLMGVRGLGRIQKTAAADFQETIEIAQTSEKYFQKASRRLDQLSGLLHYFGQGRTVVRTKKILDLGIETARGVIYGAQIAEQGSDLFKLVTTMPGQGMTLGLSSEGPLYRGPSEIESLLAEIKSNLRAVHNQLSLIQAAVKSDPGLLQFGQTLGLDDSIKASVKRLPETRELVLQAKKGIDLLPGLVGLYKKQVYLVLLQNNMELRPTGGFIGSYALVTFDKGRLLDFEVQDVYVADGQLKGHVEPPEDLKKYLGEAGWYLRDSNWDPNFSTSAVRAIWFLEKETGRTVDGVLAINLFLVQRLLGAVGEISLPDYQEKINAGNLFERAEYHAEANFFPGSTQKKDFLGSLTKALFEKIKTVDQPASLEMAKAVYQSLKEKDILIYLNDPETMTVVTDLSWDGGIREVECWPSNGASRSQLSPEPYGSGQVAVSCLADYLMVVDSNVGINKANYFVKRRLFHQVQVDSRGEVGEKLKAIYRNEGKVDIFPAGRYKNYLRIYVPLGSRLKRVTIRNPLTGEIEEVGSEKWEIGEEHGKQVFGFVLEVPIREERIVEVDYHLAERIPVKGRIQYLVLVQKQSGLRDERLDFLFLPPEGMEIVSTDPRAILTPTASAFNPLFNQDLVFEIQMVR